MSEVFNKDKFIQKYQKVPVVEYKNNTSKNPLVSVCVQTYQQESYISECLDGILMQQTSFDFEILLGEDESTDDTRKICIKYAEKFPDKIKLFLHSRENNIVIFGNPTGKFNVEYNIYNAKGKYLAICEGDDYWTDPLKLQKQIDFLEANNDYGLIYSDTNLVSENENGMEETKMFESRKKRYSRIRKIYQSGHVFWELLEKNFVNTLTVCVRKELILDYFNKFSHEDFSYDQRQWLHVASYSKIKYVNEQWACYRVLKQGISNAEGFFDKRSPLIKQSALIHYLNLINFENSRIDRKIFSKVIYNILITKYLSRIEKMPTIKMLQKHPIFLTFLIQWKMNRFFNKTKI